MKRFIFGFLSFLLVLGCDDDEKYLAPSPNVDPNLPAILAYNGSLTLLLLDQKDNPQTKIDLTIHLEYTGKKSTDGTVHYTISGRGNYSQHGNFTGEATIVEGLFSVKKQDPMRFVSISFTQGSLYTQSLRLNLLEINGNEIAGEWINPMNSEQGRLTGNTDCQKGLLSLPQ